MANKEIIHDGIVEEVRDHKVVVKFISNTACGDCHAKGFCSVPATEEKSLVVTTRKNSFMTGEKVRIVLAQSDGFRAVFLAYIMPFLFIFLILAIVNALTHNEALSGILSMAILIPYYLILWRFRNSLEKEFNFRIMKI